LVAFNALNYNTIYIALCQAIWQNRNIAKFTIGFGVKSLHLRVENQFKIV
jgi:hypothetical protein